MGILNKNMDFYFSITNHESHGSAGVWLHRCEDHDDDDVGGVSSGVPCVTNELLLSSYPVLSIHP